MIFCRANEVECPKVLEILKNYAETSGKCINFLKSALTFSTQKMGSSKSYGHFWWRAFGSGKFGIQKPLIISGCLGKFGIYLRSGTTFLAQSFQENIESLLELSKNGGLPFVGWKLRNDLIIYFMARDLLFHLSAIIEHGLWKEANSDTKNQTITFNNS